MHAILTAIGNDRPGLVDEVSQFIFDAGGNIEDSRMVNLRGQFAMMVLFSASDERIEQSRSGLSSLHAKTQLQAELRPAGASAAPAPDRARPYRLTATAIDQSGLVHRIARALRDLGANIESLDSRLAAAPYTGAPMFEMELMLTLPIRTPIARLRETLGKLCDELNVDWQLEPA
jgi:glycine cleavage system transcriptional repressor